MNKRVKWLSFLAAISALSVASAFVFTACKEKEPDDRINRPGAVDTVRSDNPDDEEGLGIFFVKNLGNEVNFHTALQRGYLEDENYANIGSYAKGTAELSIPDAVVLDWKFEPDGDLNFVQYKVDLGEEAILTEYTTYTTVSSELSIYNLKINTDYYYAVTAVYEGAEYVSKTQHFKTSDQGPRNLYIDGLTNCRDLGGRKTPDGGTVKQGLLYRTSCLSSSSNKDELFITAAGKKTMLEQLGVKTEIELRGEGANDAGGLNETTPSPLDPGVKFVYCPMRWNNIPNLLMGNNEMTKRAFAALSDENNYPVFFHCRIGTDRTGFMAILVGGLLGVPEEELYRDYLFSNFGNIGGARSLGDESSENSVVGYMKFVKSFEGETFAQKVYNYLVTIGVPSVQLDSVISIMKDGGNAYKSPAVNIKAEHIAHSDGIKATKGAYDYVPSYYYATENKTDEKLTVNVKASAAVKADAYIYINSSAVRDTLNSVLDMEVNGVEVKLSASTLNTLGCRAEMRTWVPVYLDEISLKNGDNTIVFTQLTEDGINLASVTLVPKSNCTLTKDKNSYLPVVGA